MDFILSSANPLKAVFTNVADSRSYYWVETKFHLCRNPKETTIMASPTPGVTQQLAKIEWHAISPTIIEYRGSRMNRSDFITKKAWFGLNTTFTASDGRSYTWKSGLSLNRLRLVCDDDPNTVIAISHRATLGIIGPKRHESLEVSSAAMSILDDVILTFTWSNQIRRDMEQSRHH